MIQRDVPIGPRTTFGVGGRAAFFCGVTGSDDTAECLALSRREGLPILPLGAGSNLLVADTAIRAVVVHIADSRITVHGDGRVIAHGGACWDAVVASAVARDLGGIECLSGIPGTAGAAPVQNIGAYGQSIGDVLASVNAIDLESGDATELAASECSLGYRSSIFQRRRLLITSVSLRLIPGAPPSIGYQDLATRFTRERATLAHVRSAVLDIRGRKGMLMMDGRPRLRSAGSFFRSPTVSQEQFSAIRGILSEGAPPPPRHWYWQQPDGSVKIAAGRIVERFFIRGTRFGNAGISPHHALSLVAYDGCRAADIVDLARRIQETVLRQLRITLEPEVCLIGFDPYPLLH